MTTKVKTTNHYIRIQLTPQYAKLRNTDRAYPQRGVVLWELHMMRLENRLAEPMEPFLDARARLCRHILSKGLFYVDVVQGQRGWMELINLGRCGL